GDGLSTGALFRASGASAGRDRRVCWRGQFAFHTAGSGCAGDTLWGGLVVASAGLLVRIADPEATLRERRSEQVRVRLVHGAAGRARRASRVLSNRNGSHRSVRARTSCNESEFTMGVVGASSSKPLPASPNFGPRLVPPHIRGHVRASSR